MIQKDPLYKKIIKRNNLEMAFYQLQAGQNTWYKNFYRELFLSYSINIDENIKNLHNRLLNFTYAPKDVLKFYLPKQSGLHRPISFLHLDDLIVYQAAANVIKTKFIAKRRSLNYKYVFSNIINEDTSNQHFFFNKWQIGYRKYLNKIKYYYKEKNKWVASFDLAAYYDTISHSRLALDIYRIEQSEIFNLLTASFNEWSSHSKKKIDHSIPQGPFSSDFFAEVFLLPIDLFLSKQEIKYVRYVDDIKIFGSSKEEVLSGIILLEKNCKERGLIPQSKKYNIIKAKNIDEAIGKYPSLSENDKLNILTDKSETAKMFVHCFSENSYDPSKIKYILKTSDINRTILAKVIKNITLHPELVDNFCQFLLNYVNNKNVFSRISEMLTNNIFLHEYVEGKIWELLSNFNYSTDKLLNLAFVKLKNANNKYSLKYGLYKYICSHKNTAISKWLVVKDSI